MNQLTQTLAEDTAIATGAFAQSTVVPIDNEPMPRLIVKPPLPGRMRSIAGKFWRDTIMKRITFSLVTVAAMVCVVAFTSHTSRRAAAQEGAIFVKTIPPGYRDWRLISVAREEGDLKDIRAILGNDVAIKAYREAKLPFPDGTIIARLAWSHDASEENNKTFGRPQSFVAGAPKNGIQFMVKDSKKYASTGGWGFAHFDDGKSADDEVLNSCFACHQAVKVRDFVFTNYAP